MKAEEFPVEKRRLALHSPMIFSGPIPGSHLFLEYGEKQLFAKNEVIVNIGDLTTKLYYLHKGQIKRSFFTRLGMEKTVWLMDAPALFGEALIYLGLPSSTLFTANEACEIYSVEESTLFKLAAQDTDLMKFIFTNLTRKLIVLSSQIEALCVNDPMYRVAKLLCALAYQGGKQFDGNKYVITVKLTNQEVANITGLHRVTVSKVLGKLADSRIIERQKNKIIVHDVNALKRYFT
ncbi:MAG: Crp/Fnr family transcriptional regulator [Peptococcaceae bacterium]|nr:Crp/Fnr family transcriptional regulator [Peptococcaceae bacterium]